MSDSISKARDVTTLDLDAIEARLATGTVGAMELRAMASSLVARVRDLEEQCYAHQNDRRAWNRQLDGFIAAVVRLEGERDESIAREALAAQAICGMADHAEVREARVRELDAIIEGRAEGPTNDELIAHDAAGGGWAVRPQGFTVSVTMGGPSYTHAWRERLSTQDHPARWWPLDASGRPCAWPVTT